jgi:hypothetical protein
MCKAMATTLLFPQQHAACTPSIAPPVQPLLASLPGTPAGPFTHAPLYLTPLPSCYTHTTTPRHQPPPQGLNLKRGEAVKALKATGAVSYGLASILLLTPLLGFAAIQLPLAPRELAVGLAVFCCMPTALSSGVTFTQVGLEQQRVCSLPATGWGSVRDMQPQLAPAGPVAAGTVTCQPVQPARSWA